MSDTDPPTEPGNPTSRPPPAGFCRTGYASGYNPTSPSPGESGPGVRPNSQLPRPVQPKPLPKRPKGRWFVSLLLAGFLGFLAYCGWHSFLRFEAYGTVVGRVIRVPSPWSGIVKSVHVRAGDAVRQGQLLITLENQELVQRQERLLDDLQIAQAGLDAEVVRLQWDTESRDGQHQKALAEYYELWGQLLQEDARLAELKGKLGRITRIVERGAGTREEMEAVLYAESGQRAKVEKLRAAVAELKKRVEDVEDRDQDSLRRLRPQFARIETLQAQLALLREQLELAYIRSPVNGRVIRTHRFAGEAAEFSDTVLEVLEDDSLQPVLYVPQEQAESLAVGEEIKVTVEPHSEPLACVVTQFGQRFEAAPDDIQRFYRSPQSLLPVYLNCKPGPDDTPTLRLGSRISVPYSWQKMFAQPDKPALAEDPERRGTRRRETRSAKRPQLELPAE